MRGAHIAGVTTRAILDSISQLQQQISGCRHPKLIYSKEVLFLRGPYHPQHERKEDRFASLEQVMIWRRGITAIPGPSTVRFS